jgi:hypothetical protein
MEELQKLLVFLQISNSEEVQNETGRRMDSGLSSSRCLLQLCILKAVI